MSEREQTIPAVKAIFGDKDYFKGSEQGTAEDWVGLDYRGIPGTWVLQEKMFAIPTIKGDLIVRIVETDPHQFKYGTRNTSESDQVAISYIFDVLNVKDFPVVLMGENIEDKREVFLRRSGDTKMVSELPPVLRDLAETFNGKINRITKSYSDEWINFLLTVLSAKGAVPVPYDLPPDNLVKEELEMEPDETVTEEDKILTAMKIAEQEMLGYAFADLTIYPAGR